MKRNKILKFCKRCLAFLSACFIFSYSLVTAPIFSNSIVAYADWHDIAHDPRVSSVIDWGYNAVGSVIDRTQTALSHLPADQIFHFSEIPQGVRSSLDLVYNIVRPDGFLDLAETEMQDITNTGDWREINVDTSMGITGAYFRNGSWHPISMFTHSKNTFPGNTYFPLLEGEDLAIYMKVLPADGYGPEDITIIMSESVNSGSYSTFNRTFSFSPSQSARLTFYFYSYGDWVTYDYGIMNYSTLTFNFRIYGSSSDSSINIETFTLPTDLSSVRSYFIPRVAGVYSVIIGCCDRVANFNSGSLISGQSSVINTENIYNYYDKRVYSTYKNTITNYNFNTVQYYYDQIIENLPTEITPTETIDPSQPTGSGTVVIIDPFTLPPDWLEDDAELDTNHYVLDSEQWESPFETITRYKHQTSALSLEDETDPWLDDGALVTASSVLNAIEGLQIFCVKLFTDSGTLTLVASLLAFGLILRLISLK